MGFSEDLEAAKTAERKTAEEDVLLNGNLYTVRFVQMDGLDWAAETDRHPARPGVLIDLRYGYNLRSLVKAVAPLTGTVLKDGEEVQLRVDPVDPKNPSDPNRVDEWRDFLKAISGAAVLRLGSVIWALNQWDPDNAIDAAKKERSNSKSISS